MGFDIEKHSGAGIEELDKGSNMPIIRILQDQSPQINSRKKEYIEGAKAGNLYWNKTKEVLPNPLRFIPLSTRSCYVEWTPLTAGGGFVGNHGLDVVNNKNYRKEGMDEYLGSNDLKFTTYWAVLFQHEENWVDGLLAMTSSQLRVSRELALSIDKFRYANSPSKAPIFARILFLDTILEKNKAGQEYFNFSIGVDRVLDFNNDEALLDRCVERRGSLATALPSPDVKKLTVVATDVNNDEAPF
jgi:hypothetical protein